MRLFSTNNENPVGPHCSYSLVGSLWSQRISYPVWEHQSSQIVTHWCGKCYGFPLSVPSSAFLQGNVDSIPACRGWPDRYGDSSLMITNGTIIRFTTKHRTEKLLIQRSYHFTQSTWKECSRKNCYEFWKSVKKLIRPCKRHFPITYEPFPGHLSHLFQQSVSSIC